MVSAITDIVEIELLIEGKRSELYRRITRKKPPNPPRRPKPPDRDTYQLKSKASLAFQDMRSTELPRESPSLPTLILDQACTSIQASSIRSEFIKPITPQDDKSLKYNIKNSYLSKDKSERVFIVEYEGTERCYYAFEFKNYIICPAFFISRLKLTEYACLSVTNTARYYYIFLNKSNDDLFLTGFADQDFLGDCYFKVPAEDHRLLSLGSHNKDMKCFIERKLAFKDELGEECDEYRQNPLRELRRCQVYRSYWFVPEKTKKEFQSKYLPLFPSEFDLMFTALVHEESSSYLAIGKMMNRVKPAEEISMTRATLQKIYDETVYEKEDYILEKLVNHIKANYSKSREKKVEKYYCSMMSILQSSGYGKSKLMEKLGSKTPTFYSSLQQGTGYPAKSIFLTKLIKELDEIVVKGIPGKGRSCYINNVSTAVYIYLLRILFIILKNHNNESLKKSFLIDSEIKNHPSYYEISGTSTDEKDEKIFKLLFKELKALCISVDDIRFDGSYTFELKSLKIVQDLSLDKFAFKIGATEYLTKDLEGEVMTMLEKLGVDGNKLPSIFVVDEAHWLRRKKLEDGREEEFDWKLKDIEVQKKVEREVTGRSPYNVFRRAFRMFTNSWERIMLIIVSTSGQISVLLPELDLDTSRRPQTSSMFMENFSLIQTYSANSKIARSISAEMFPDDDLSIKNWMEFLDSDFRKIQYFKFGRPLTWGIFNLEAKKSIDEGEYDRESDFKNCKEFSFMATKLFGGQEYGETKVVGLLYCMFNFAFGTNFLPTFVNKQDLIENYLMTLVKYVEDYELNANYVVGGFFPEGVINFLSARYFCQYVGTISKVLDSSAKCGLCNIGNFGELVAQHILLYNVFSCNDDSFQKVRKLAFEPVFLEKFLRRLIVSGDLNEHISKESVVDQFFMLNPALRGSKVSFGYFEHFPEYPLKKPFDLMARYLFRGSAASLHHLYPGIDLMIPLILECGKISFLGIQVKFIRDETTVNSVAKNAAKKMNFPYMFDLQQSQEQQSDRPFGLIMLIIGDYKFDTFILPVNEPELDSEQDYRLIAPRILAFRGKIPTVAGLDQIVKSVPSDVFYRGINPKYMEECDYMHDLTKELFPSLRKESESSKASLPVQTYLETKSVSSPTDQDESVEPAAKRLKPSVS